MKNKNLKLASILVALTVAGAGLWLLNSRAATVGDLNNDGTVNIFDLSMLLSKWGTNTASHDLNSDSTVNIFDLSILLSKWGTSGSACTGGQIGTPPNCVPAPPAPVATNKQWNIVFNESFNGTTLDTTKLSPCFDWNYGDCTGTFNNGKERYMPSQVKVNNGTAKLVAEPLSPPYANSGCYQGQCTYKAGLLSTARPRADNGSNYLFPFTYGYVESRMKFPGEPGFFTAFWMLPTDPTYSYGTEIDIVEILGGYPETIFMHYHYNDRSDSFRVGAGGIDNNGNCAFKDYSQDWVTFGLDWQPNHLAWYIDGVKCGQFNGSPATIENGPMQLILHMMIDNNWERDWGSVLTSQSLVRQLEVDYIRIYQQQ